MDADSKFDNSSLAAPVLDRARLHKLEKAASLGKLAGSIAHEIKNPLSFINSFSRLSLDLVEELQQLLKSLSQNPDTDIAEFQELLELLKSNLEKIEQHGLRADQVVADTLQDLTSVSSQSEYFDFNNMVADSIAYARHSIPTDGKPTHIEIAPDLDPNIGEIMGYPRDLTRVLINVIENAIHATLLRWESGAHIPTIHIKTKASSDKVTVSVTDNGVGIDEKDLSKVFTPFFTTKSVHEGTGLGLSLSQDIIVGQHGGTIEIDSKKGSYTRVDINLPIVQKDANE